MIELNFSKGDGLLPAITQDYKSGKVLMLAFINRDSFEKMLDEYYDIVGWDRVTGAPKEEKLKELGIDNLVRS